MNSNPSTTRQGKNMNLNFPKIEKKILKFWKKNRIFENSIEQRKKAPNFVFYEGPPTANAAPGIHHVLARAYKDIICRYKTMRGFKVLRKAGWDTHGLPVELEIEKKLGLKTKKDIEKYGIAKFNQKCKESVWAYKKDWEKLTERIAFWLDMENPYITYESDYIETVWWIIKQIYQKGLLYQDYKVVPYCSRCGTSLSSHEVALGYEKIKEPAIYIKFEILNPKFETKGKIYFLVWTTTPWTLPGNVAIAVNPEFNYAEVKINNEYLILAKERLSILAKDYELVREFRGKDLTELRYQPLYPPDAEISKTAYKVIPADFVSLEEGTGLVHVAPAFGEEDMEAGKKNNLPILLNVDGEGKFTLDVKKWAGLYVKDADSLIIEDLKESNLLFKEELYEHDYPFCWRCDSPLLYYAKQGWFINMQKVKKDLIKNNQKINWVPTYLKAGRFGEWLKEIKDWALSRERYWGTPLPIWQCWVCGNLEFIGSKKDLISQKFSKNKYFALRHGDSLRNQKDITSCWPEKNYLPLTKKGEKQIKEAAKKLKKEKIDLIFSSDLLRTKQTAEIIGKELELKPKFDKRLREVNVGIFNGKPIREIGRFWDEEGKLPPLEYYLKRFQVAPPKGENYTDIEKRLYFFMKEIDKNYQDKNVLIVGHQRPLTLLEKVVNGHDLKKFVKIVATKKEIKTGEVRKLEFKNLPYNEKMELDFHRPYIDEVKFYCQKCGGLIERTKEVIDCWFDSGSMPFGQAHWPFNQNEKLAPYRTEGSGAGLKPPKFFPADYISEAIDQTRGWFYTLLAISTLLGFGTSYKNVISLGHVLNEKGEKMSKSKGNVVDPWQILEKYGADITRWYFYTVNQPGDAKIFSEKGVEEVLKRFIIIFWNCALFFQTYGQSFPRSSKSLTKRKNILDRWIISKLNNLIQGVTENLDKYEVTFATRAIEDFVIEDLSLWYIRRSRRRFHPALDQSSLRGKEAGKDFEEASRTLSHLLLTLSKLTAPFIPFLSEELYRCLICHIKQQGLKSQVKTSIHLTDWPKVNKKLINNKLEKKMEKIRQTVTLALAERAKAKIKVRQPLQKLKIKDQKLKTERELLDLIKEEVNVKEIVFDPKIEAEIELDTKITPELKEEGTIREIIRQIQEMRKMARLKPKDRILVRYFGTPDLNEILARNEKFILKEAKAKDLILGERPKEIFDLEKHLKVEQKELWLAIKKI